MSFIFVAISYEEFEGPETFESVSVHNNEDIVEFDGDDVIKEFNKATKFAKLLSKSTGKDIVLSSTIDNFTMDNEEFYITNQLNMRKK